MGKGQDRGDGKGDENNQQHVIYYSSPDKLGRGRRGVEMHYSLSPLKILILPCIDDLSTYVMMYRKHTLISLSLIVVQWICHCVLLLTMPSIGTCCVAANASSTCAGTDSLWFHEYEGTVMLSC